MRAVATQLFFDEVPVDNHPILLFLTVAVISYCLTTWSRAYIAHHRRRAVDAWHRLHLRDEASGSFSEALGVTPCNNVQQRATVNAEDE